MAWPTNAINTTFLDEDTDSPASARPELKKLADNMNLMRLSRGNADGVPSLDLSGLIPSTQLPVVPAIKGGTGQLAYTPGDILYASAFNILSKLSAGAAGYALTSNGAGLAPSWSLIKPSITTQSVTADFSVAQTDLSKNFFHSGAAYTYTLPDVSSVTDGFFFYVTFYSGTLNFATTNSQLIYGHGASNLWGVTTASHPNYNGWRNVNAFLVMKNNSSSWMVIPISRSSGSQVFLAAGSWLCPPGVTQVSVSGIGGGGASGTDGGCVSGSGGSGAAAFRKTIVTSPGTSYAITIGLGGATSGAAGGSSTFGGLFTLNGGAGGSNSAASTVGASGAAGTPNYRFETTTSTNLGSDFTAGYGGGGGGNNAGSFNVGNQGMMIVEW